MDGSRKLTEDEQIELLGAQLLMSLFRRVGHPLDYKLEQDCLALTSILRKTTAEEAQEVLRQWRKNAVSR